MTRSSMEDVEDEAVSAEDGSDGGIWLDKIFCWDEGERMDRSENVGRCRLVRRKSRALDQPCNRVR